MFDCAENVHRPNVLIQDRKKERRSLFNLCLSLSILSLCNPLSGSTKSSFSPPSFRGFVLARYFCPFCGFQMVTLMWWLMRQYLLSHKCFTSLPPKGKFCPPLSHNGHWTPKAEIIFTAGTFSLRRGDGPLCARVRVRAPSSLEVGKEVKSLHMLYSTGNFRNSASL